MLMPFSILSGGKLKLAQITLVFGTRRMRDEFRNSKFSEIWILTPKEVTPNPTVTEFLRHIIHYNIGTSISNIVV